MIAWPTRARAAQSSLDQSDKAQDYRVSGQAMYMNQRRNSAGMDGETEARE